MNSVGSNTTPVAATESQRPRVRSRVRWWDMVAVAWCQHRLMLTGTSVCVLALAAGLVYVGAYTAASIPHIRLDLLILLVQAYGLLLAVFWTAPLVAREYEHRTHLWAWSQDVSPTRWLAGKGLLLLTVGAVSALLLGFCGQFLIHRIPGQNPYAVPFFDAAPLPQLGYALFGFALGLALSALTRRSVLSMGLSLAAFLTIRILVAFYIRPRYQTPVQVATISTGDPVPANAWVTRINHSHVYFQPPDRLGNFQLIEFGIYTAFAVLLLLFTWRLLHRVNSL